MTGAHLAALRGPVSEDIVESAARILAGVEAEGVAA